MFNFFESVIKLIRIVFLTVSFAIGATKKSKLNTYSFYNYSKRWAKKVLKIAKVEVEILGIDNISIDEKYLFAANHSSFFDIPILISILPFELSIIYKKELEKVPFFGKSLVYSPFIGVERDSAKGARVAIKDTLKLFKDNKSVLIFPEGTRSFDGKLLPFKEGAFFIAKATKQKIVPVTIIGSYNVLERGSYKINSGKVTVVINKPVEASKELVEIVMNENLISFAESN